MKHILLAFLILLAFPVFGQNYRTVLVGEEMYFNFSEKAISRVILTDSFEVINNDTIIYHQFNQEFEKSTFLDSSMNEWTCYYAVDTGFLGYKTILQTNGTDVFFNRFQDSIFIQTQANLNHSWGFYQNPDGSYFEATITAIDYDNFLGINDSVKTITLQAKNASGNVVTSPYDALQIKISQHHGLVEGFNFFRFPYGVTFSQNDIPYFEKINLIGLPHLDLGVDNLTAAEIYDFNIGDEFHRLTSSWLPPYGRYELIKINGKYFSQNQDTVFYNVHLTEFTYDYIPFVGVQPLDTIFIGDTMVFYNISAGNVLNTKSLLRDTISTLWVQSAGGLEKSTRGDEPYLNTNDCYLPSVSPTSSGKSTYRAGFGLFEWYFNQISVFVQNNLVYYKKNGVEWGIPINIDSLSTISTDEIVKTDFNLKVFPNPTNNLLNFELETPQKNTEIRLFSTLGQEVKRIYFDNENYQQIDVSDWNSGVYFYGGLVEGNLVKQGQVLIEN